MQPNCFKCWQAVPNFEMAVENNKGPDDLKWPADYRFACVEKGKCHPLLSDVKPFRGNSEPLETIVLKSDLTITRTAGPITIKFFNTILGRESL